VRGCVEDIMGSEFFLANGFLAIFLLVPTIISFWCGMRKIGLLGLLTVGGLIYSIVKYW